jgi:hypothetical protein
MDKLHKIEKTNKKLHRKMMRLTGKAEIINDLEKIRDGTWVDTMHVEWAKKVLNPIIQKILYL